MSTPTDPLTSPTPLALWCPHCHAPHVDEGVWATRPHKTHQCQACGHEWRPFEYPTVGVRQLAPPPRTPVVARPSECQKAAWKGKCCCSCQHHLPDMSHPGTDGGRVTEQRGWVCAPPEWEGVHSGWTEHGLCEMWSARRAESTLIRTPALKLSAPGAAEEHF